MTLTELYIFVLYLLIALTGLAVGSFLNVVIYRIPRGESIAYPASHCTSCGAPIKWYDNIPVLSYILLRGKCRSCGEKIPIRYPLVELLNATSWVLCAVMSGKSPIYALISLAISSILIAIAFIDIDHLLIFNRFTAALALLGIAAVHFDAYTAWYDHIIGLGAAALVFFGIYYAARALLGCEGLGLGDVKLAIAAGLLLGWQKFLLAMIVSSIIASIVLLVLRKLRHDKRDSEYPFGPFLAFGIWFSMLFGEAVVNAYINAIFSIL